MKRVTLLPLFFLVGFLVLMTIFTTVGPVFSETIFNDNSEIKEGLVSGNKTHQTSTPSRSLDNPARRFVVVLNNQAVLDRETGLVWEKDTGGKFNWQEAINHCYNAYIGGRGGWRLPTIAELTTLIDKSQTPILGEPFTNVKSSNYWSSTTHASYTNGTWLVDFGSGGVYSGNKSSSYYVRAVRSGQ